MAMKRLFPVILILLLGKADIVAQRNDIGLFLGVAKYKGELSNSFFTTHFIHPAFGVYYRDNFNKHWSFRLGATIANVSGDDAYSKYDFEVNRNLSFSSSLQEIEGRFEFNFTPYELGSYQYLMTSFLFGGLSAFHFNPKAVLRGEEIELQPLGTEGQGIYADRQPYSLFSAALLFGGGFKINGDNIGFTIEMGVRRAYTDYLDDVSTTYPDPVTLAAINGQDAADLSDRTLGYDPLHEGKMRGNSKDPDWYMFTGVSAYIAIGKRGKYSCLPHHRRHGSWSGGW
jgi:hypothetical protein